MTEQYRLEVSCEKIYKVVNGQSVPNEVCEFLDRSENVEIYVDDEQARWEIQFHTSQTPPDSLESILLEIFRERADSLRDLTVSVAEKSPEANTSSGSSHTSDLSEPWEQLKQDLYQKTPMSRSFFQYARPVLREDRLIVELPNKQSVQNCRSQQFDRFIQAWFQKHEGIDLKVKFAEGDFSERLKNDAEQIRKEEQEKIEKQERRREVKQQKKQDHVIVGKTIQTDPIPIEQIGESEQRNVTVEGELVETDLNITGKNKKNVLTGIVTNRKDSIEFKQFLDTKISELEGMEGKWLRIRGPLKNDNYRGGGEKVIFLNDANQIPPKIRKDDAPEKRVELHCHSNMSALDALTEVEQLVERAAYWDHPALAITDHGVAHSFPEAARAAKEYGVKVIFGVEGYLVDDDRPVILNGVDSDVGSDRPWQDYIVLDCETTGISPHTDEIFQIAALHVKEGEIVNDFHSTLQTEGDYPRIVERTQLEEDQLNNAPPPEIVFEELSEFIDDRPIFAYEADVLRNFIESAGFRFDQPMIHVRRLVDHVWNPPTLSLDSLIERRHGQQRDQSLDARVDVQHTKLLIEELEESLEQMETLDDLREIVADPDKTDRSNHIILLAKNQKGLENLYRLVSLSHVDNFYRQPRLFRSNIEEHREGIIVGSACESGEIFQSVIQGESDEQIKERMRFYDLIEIQPAENNRFMLKKGDEFNDITSQEDIEALTRKIHDLGQEMGKLVVGTGDVHFLDPEDEIFRRILQSAQEYSDADHQPPLYYRTTEEMIDAFSFLGEDRAIDVVVNNPRTVADWCEPVEPIPDGFYPPEVEDAEEDFLTTIQRRVKELYGKDLPNEVTQRLEKERSAIVENQFSNLYVVASRLVEKSRDDGYLVGSRGSVGSSFTAYLMGITEVNPLPAHYRCPNDSYVEFPEQAVADVGVDLPKKNCPHCGEKLVRDGFHIPFEVFLGFEGNKIPDIDLNFSGEYQQEMFRFVQEMFGEEHVIRAGTISTVAEKTAGGFVNSYFSDKDNKKRTAETKRLKSGLQGVKQTSGQHPGGMIIVPEDESIFRFTPINYPANDQDADFLTTHFDYHAMEDQLVKLDILGHDDPTQLRHLQDLTGVDPEAVPLDDQKTLQIFSDISVLGIEPDQLGMETGVLGVPEFGTSFVRGMVEETRPNSFADLIRISGLSHGTDVWLNNAQEYIRRNLADLRSVITCRDDIMNRLIDSGLPEKKAFQIMEDVRKGRGLDQDQKRAMKANDVPGWYIQSCEKIKYLFPKAHAAAYVTMAFRIAYYKVHYPDAFYASYFTLKADSIDARYIGSLPQVEERMRELKALIDRREHTARDTHEYSTMEVVKEAYLRGIQIEPPKVSSSDPLQFQRIDQDTLLAPYVTTKGMGRSVALSVREAADERRFTSIEDAENRTGLNQGIVETAREYGFFEGLPDTENIDLFTPAG